ncbi:MAG: hypothetical protein KY468_09970 [Armatimonadetes bacterium]|nr:hypothetical protein [Armatimonadota bacterium]
MWRMVQEGFLTLHRAGDDEIERIIALMERYQDTPMDLADASLVAAAETLTVSEVFAPDRHFYAYRMSDARAFTVLP